MDRAAPHLPYPATIDAYGHGGFRFADMSHRGSLLCLPAGIWASSVVRPQDITEDALALVLDPAESVEFCLIGTGRDPWPLPQGLRARFRERHISIEAMTTGAAVRTYNILLGERRRVAALLVAVD